VQVSLSNHKSIEASIRNLETQLGQLAKIVEENFEMNFIANTKVESKEHFTAIITRSENVYKKRKEEKNNSGEYKDEKKK